MSEPQTRTILLDKEAVKTISATSLTLILSSFAFVVGLMWRDVVTKTIDLVFPTANNQLIPLIIVAFLFTIILVVVVYEKDKYIKTPALRI